MASLLTHYSSISPSNTRTQSCFIKQNKKTFGFNVNNNNTGHVKLSKRGRPSIVSLAAVEEQAPSFQFPDLTKDATLKSLKFKLLVSLFYYNFIFCGLFMFK